MNAHGAPERQGLYDPKFEHDACGIGMLVNVTGKKSHGLLKDAIEILKNLTHRGGVGSEPDTGDGAGILLQLPHAFFARVMAAQEITLPAEGDYGVAMLYASPDADRRDSSLRVFCTLVQSEGFQVLGERRVPVCAAGIGKTAAAVCPSIRQMFIARPEGIDRDAFERQLYILSKLASKTIRHPEAHPDPYFYIASISSRTIVYKGMLLPSQLPAFYLDLQDGDLVSAIALVHSRFSTNTFPSWERAHPQRYIIHNGEINTIRGNLNWMKARQGSLESTLFGEDLQKAIPVIDENGSDSAMLDDYLSLLVHAGRSLPEAMMLAIPEPWEDNPGMEPAKRAFYQYNSCLQEPWDGPAAVAFTDGVLAGATLDRNGLRPARYVLTKSGTLILASEVGVLHVPEEDILRKNRLHPGRMLLIDTGQGRIIEDEELKGEAASAHPYAEWLAGAQRNLSDLSANGEDTTWTAFVAQRRTAAGCDAREQARLKQFSHTGPYGERGGPNEKSLTEPPVPDPTQQQKLFGYTYEDTTLSIQGMAESGDDPLSSMGTDTPLAVLSRRPQLLYNYFKQLFAQVTNPPIDAIREKVITSSAVQFGSEGNLLEPVPQNCRMIVHGTPILSPAELDKLRGTDHDGFQAVTLPILFEKAERRGLEKGLEELFAAAEIAIAGGCNILVLSDEGACREWLPIPALLATAGLHHHLIRLGNRTQVSLVVESCEVREVHHAALLVGYGANGVCPTLAYRTIARMAEKGRLSVDIVDGLENYRNALTKNLIKVMSKMGISTVRSYHGAQIFEALGVNAEVVEKYFTGTTTRIGGVGLWEIENEVRARHETAFGCENDAGILDPAAGVSAGILDPGGDYKWRKNGEYHLFNPENIFYLQQSCRTGDYNLFKRYTSCVNTRTRQLKNIRGLLSIVTSEKPIPLDTVEPVENIIRRFKTGAMSYGSISREAHECMAVAMNRLGGRSNTGEGGEEPDRFLPRENGDDPCSAIKQVASGRFGVTIHYLRNATEIQIKMAQGAKPGEGGHLPASKVYPWIAKSRHSTPGVELISPPPHHDIYSIEDLAQLIHDLKNANPKARVSVKLVSEAGVGTVAVGVAKGLADVILVSGYDGGTGAASRTSIRHAGLPWELGLAEAHQSLLMNNMRGRVVLETDGKLLTGRDIIIAALLGAEEFGFATAPLVVMGCDMMRVCNLDTCPVGVATQNPELRSRFSGKLEYVENLMRFLAQEVREWMAKIGVRSLDELVGHVELLRQKPREQAGEKAGTVDLSALLYQPHVADGIQNRHFRHPQDHSLEKTLDAAVLLPLCQDALEKGERVTCHLSINNRARTVGCMLSGEVVRNHGPEGLPADSVILRFDGSAGQSFGAFLAPGVTLHLAGDTNDYLGKGLSGGRIAITPPKAASYTPQENIIAGNVALYGATSGEVYIRGMAGERFAVRNSGASAVVEGVGDHGCEYMTGGRVAVLGETGRNFAAGMSGGIAYVLDRSGKFRPRCNTALVGLLPLETEDRAELQKMLENHLKYTGSTLAAELLEKFERNAKDFVKVIPHDYSKVLKALENAKKQSLPQGEQLLYAFNSVVNGSARH